MKLTIKALLLSLIILAIAACSSKSEKYTEVTPDNGLVKIDIDTVSDGEAHFYHMNIDGKDFKFFLVKAKDGVIRAAFDACDVCFPQKKGYRQEGDNMVCNNCGQQFSTDQINEVRGGCNPSPLERTESNGQVVIKVSDINSGAKYF